MSDYQIPAEVLDEAVETGATKLAMLDGIRSFGVMFPSAAEQYRRQARATVEAAAPLIAAAAYRAGQEQALRDAAADADRHDGLAGETWPLKSVGLWLRSRAKLYGQEPVTWALARPLTSNETNLDEAATARVARDYGTEVNRG